jgi:hypothetical protein
MYQQLSTDTDKKNACLVCKEMQALITPLLYKDMEIFADRLDEAFSTTLQGGHSGLSRVRTLCVMPGPEPEPSSFPVMWHNRRKLQVQVICRLLNAIPRNSLTRFEYETTDS